MATGKNLAILVSALGAGGAERVIAQLCRHWTATGHRITVITFDRDDDPVFHKLPADVTLVRLGDRTGTGLAGNLRRLRELRRTLDQVRPEVLVSFLTKNNLLAALASVGLPIKLVCCERNNPERQGAHWLWNEALRLAYRRADAIVCQTEAVRRCFPTAVQQRIRVIPNPIAGFERSGAADEACRIAAVGRLTHQKGFDLLIDAFAEIADRHPEWTLDIWGSGPEEHQLRDQIQAKTLAHRVVLRGTSEKPGGWVGDATVFVLSSRYEGFPNVLGEAMASGLPVIATRCDFGPEDMIDDGRSGLLVKNEDPRALAERMERLITDESLRRRLAEQAPKAAANFASEAVFAKWDRMIDGLTAGLAPADRARKSGETLQGLPAE